MNPYSKNGIQTIYSKTAAGKVLPDLNFILLNSLQFEKRLDFFNIM